MGRRNPAVTVSTIVVATALAGCATTTDRYPDADYAAAPTTSSLPTDAAYFTAYPSGVDLDPDATCVDAALPNITVDDVVAATAILFDDRRRQFPEQSSPTPEQLEQQKREGWNHELAEAVPPGGDGAYARQVCGLASLSGTLYSGTPLRGIRGYVAEQGRQTCAQIAAMQTAEVWQEVRTLAGNAADAAAGEYRVRAAIEHVCPHLAERIVPSGLMMPCADITPDPSARPGEGIFCRVH